MYVRSLWCLVVNTGPQCEMQPILSLGELFQDHPIQSLLSNAYSRAWPSKWGHAVPFEWLQKWAWPPYFVLPLRVRPGTGQSRAKSM